MSRTTKRIATVKATGKKYVVRHIDFSGPTPIVRCWGEVISTTRKANRHDEHKSFHRDEVDVSTVEWTPELHNELLRQGAAYLRSKGYRVHRTRKGNYKVYPPERVRRLENEG